MYLIGRSTSLLVRVFGQSFYSFPSLRRIHIFISWSIKFYNSSSLKCEYQVDDTTEVVLVELTHLCAVLHMPLDKMISNMGRDNNQHVVIEK